MPMLSLQLNSGTKIVEALKQFAVENNIDYGFVESAEGRIREFELFVTGQRSSIQKMEFQNDFIIQAMSGKIQRDLTGNVYLDLRVSVSSTGFTPISGKLIKGKASGPLEIVIRKVDSKKMIEA